MENMLLTQGMYPEAFLRKTVDYILSVQTEDGCIPWFTGGKADPWDHIEAAMGLTIAGEYEAARNAYRWLLEQQLDDGSWYANYQDSKPLYCDKRETNFVAYIATGLWHYFLITRDDAFLQETYPMVHDAMEFIVRNQAPTGEIYWAVSESGEPLKDALVTACSSVYKSLECAINIAVTLGQNCSVWRECYSRLGVTLRNHPECFDRTWESKERYSMDWFYPILAGVYDQVGAKARINERWDKFVRPDMGCLCVSDEPWVTVAESCELTMALLAAGERDKAAMIYSWLHQWRDESDGGYWTGYQYVEKIIWPEEKTAWTAGAILLAADALTDQTPASRLFLENNVLLPAEQSQSVNRGEFVKQS